VLASTVDYLWEETSIKAHIRAKLKVYTTVLQDVWPEVLRCISRFELLSQMATGGITDMALFAPPTPEPASPSGFTRFRLGLFASTAKQPKLEGVDLIIEHSFGVFATAWRHASFDVSCTDAPLFRSCRESDEWT
jgi:hypothetical protein